MTPAQSPSTRGPDAMLVGCAALCALLGAPPAGARVHAVDVTASSSLRTTWNKFEENYLPPYAADDDARTAWVEGADGSGAGEWLELQLLPIAHAQSVTIEIVPGYQKSKALLEANAAPRDVTITVYDATGAESGRARATLERKMGAQRVTVGPLKGGVARVRVLVDSVHEGKTYKDLCVSDVRVHVETDAAIDDAAQKALRGRLLAWKKERVDAAKFFAKLPPSYPFAAGDFTEHAPRKPLAKVRVPLGGGDSGARIKEPAQWTVEALLARNDPVLAPLPDDARAAVREVLTLRAATAPPPGAQVRRVDPPLLTRSSGGATYKLTQRVPAGLRALEPLRGLLTLKDVALSEAATDQGNRIVTERVDAIGWDRDVTEIGNAFVWRRADGSVERMFLMIREVEKEGESGTFTTTSHCMLHYAGDTLARAACVAVRDRVFGGVAYEGFDVLALARGADGKIDAVSSHEARLTLDWTPDAVAHLVLAAHDLRAAR